jgi:protein-tyrosine kinase
MATPPAAERETAVEAEETRVHILPSVGEALRLIVRRFWVVLLVGGVIGGVTFFGARRFRPAYEASALLQLKQPSKVRVGQADQDAAEEAPGPQETVRHLKANLTSNRILVGILERYKADFLPGELAKPDVLMGWLGTYVELDHRGSNNYRLFARAKEPDLARRVCAYLAETAVTLHRSGFEEEATRGEAFTRSQIQRASEAIKKLEDEMVAFLEKHPSLKIKSLNSDQLLGLQESDRMRARSGAASVLSRSLEKLAARDPKLKDLLARQRRLKAELHALTSSETAGASGAVSQALREAKNQLAELRSEGKKDGHPMVAQVLRRIKELESKLSATAPGKQTASSQFEARVRDELIAVEKEIRAAIGALAAGTPQPLKEDTTALEAEWSRLRRQHQQATEEYTNLQKEATNATMRRNLMMFEASKTAAITENPTTPDRPIGLNRTVILLAGCVVALLLGLAAALALGIFDTRLYTPDRVTRANGRLDLLAVLARHTGRQVQQTARLRQQELVAKGDEAPSGDSQEQKDSVIRWLKNTDDLDTALELLKSPEEGSAPAGKAEWLDAVKTSFYDSHKGAQAPGTGMIRADVGLPASPRPAAAAPAPLPQLKVRTLPSAPPLAPGLFVSTAPDSAPAEQMRKLAARLESRLASGLRVVVVSSWDRGVGKTTVAANLAMVLAESQRRVLVIDGCPGAAALTRVFGIEPEGMGLCEQLLRRLDGDSSPWEVVQIAETLTILPGSATEQPALPLLSSEAFSRLVHDMSQLFDALVIDTEALEASSDAVVLQRKVDGYVIVASRGRSTTRSLREIATRIELKRILGVVFNEHG